MSKLTKVQSKSHEEACALLAKPVLTLDERFFVLENWQESANHVNSAAGAFFTPVGLARDFAVEVEGKRIIDLCAGIGALSFALRLEWRRDVEIVCVEINPAYAEIGRKIVPEATWVVADIFDLPGLGFFDCVIGNPPFGGIARSGKAPRYMGKAFEYHLIDIASDLGRRGAFIVPQMSAPFAYSGRPSYLIAGNAGYAKFEAQTGISLRVGVPVDTSFHKDAWRGVAPSVEIVLADFDEARERRASQVSSRHPQRQAPASSNVEQQSLFDDSDDRRAA